MNGITTEKDSEAQAKVSKAKSRIPPPKLKLTGGNKINGLISAEKSNQRSTLETPEEGEEDVKRSTKPVKEVRVLKASEKKRKEKDRLLVSPTVYTCWQRVEDFSKCLTCLTRPPRKPHW
jgi:hypothetical protein